MSYNLYSTLGVAREADDVAIRSAYRRRALDTHPDKGGLADLFREVVGAFETLSDAQLRSTYDASLRKCGSRDGLASACLKTRGKRKGVPASSSSVIATADAASSEQRTAQRPRKAPGNECTAETGATEAGGAEAGVPHAGVPSFTDNKAETLWDELTSCAEDDCQRQIQDLSFRTLEGILRMYSASFTPKSHRKENKSSVQQRLAVKINLGEMSGDSGEASSSDSHDREDDRNATVALALCDEINLGDSLGDSGGDGRGDGGKEVESAHAQAPATSPTRQRGIFLRGDGGYCAAVGWRGLYVVTQSTRLFSEIVDRHIMLVRFKQLATANAAAGEDYEAAVRGALTNALRERSEEVGSKAPRLYFSSVVSVKGKIATPNVANLEKAFELRQMMHSLKADGGDRDVLIAEKNRMMSVLKEERQAARTAASEEQNSAKIAAKLAAGVEKSANREAVLAERCALKRRGERLRFTVRALRAQLRLFSRSLRCAVPDGLDAVEMADFTSPCRAVFVYAELDVCRGPLRSCTREALSDRQLLHRILTVQGKAAAILEAERLDVEAAVARFAATF